VSWVCLLLLLAAMTLEEKVGQMTQAERGAVTDDPSLVTTWRLGSLLSGGGSVPTPNTPEAWADMVDGFQERALETRLGIPLIYGADSVHGHGNLVGATVFPHNIGLGATRIVVVGETPYAEGFGDVGGPLWQDNGVPRASPRRCGCRTPTGPPSTGSAGRSASASWWSSPAGHWS
jgi:hypothetical protein